MSTAELKSNIHTLVENTSDGNVLSIIYTILSGLKKQKKSSITLTASEKKAADEALNSVKKGNIYPHAKVMEDMKKKYPSIIK